MQALTPTSFDHTDLCGNESARPRRQLHPGSRREAIAHRICRCSLEISPYFAAIAVFARLRPRRFADTAKDMRKTTIGMRSRRRSPLRNAFEVSAQIFWAECLTRWLSAQHFRSIIQPNYHGRRSDAGTAGNGAPASPQLAMNLRYGKSHTLKRGI